MIIPDEERKALKFLFDLFCLLQEEASQNARYGSRDAERKEHFIKQNFFKRLVLSLMEEQSLNNFQAVLQKILLILPTEPRNLQAVIKEKYASVSLLRQDTWLDECAKFFEQDNIKIAISENLKDKKFLFVQEFVQELEVCKKAYDGNRRLQDLLKEEVFTAKHLGEIHQIIENSGCLGKLTQENSKNLFLFYQRALQKVPLGDIGYLKTLYDLKCAALHDSSSADVIQSVNALRALRVELLTLELRILLQEGYVNDVIRLVKHQIFSDSGICGASARFSLPVLTNQENDDFRKAAYFILSQKQIAAQCKKGQFCSDYNSMIADIEADYRISSHTQDYLFSDTIERQENDGRACDARTREWENYFYAEADRILQNYQYGTYNKSSLNYLAEGVKQALYCRLKGCSFIPFEKRSAYLDFENNLCQELNTYYESMRHKEEAKIAAATSSLSANATSVENSAELSPIIAAPISPAPQEEVPQASTTGLPSADEEKVSVQGSGSPFLLQGQRRSITPSASPANPPSSPSGSSAPTSAAEQSTVSLVSQAGFFSQRQSSSSQPSTIGAAVGYLAAAGITAAIFLAAPHLVAAALLLLLAVSAAATIGIKSYAACHAGRHQAVSCSR